MGNLWNRSSTLTSSGGITSRTGSGTEEVFRTQSTPAAQAQSSSSGGTGFWGKIKNFVSNHAEGAGEATGVGLSVGAKIADKFTGGLATPIIDIAKEGLATIGDQFEGTGFQKFTKGLTNKKISAATDKASNVFKNDKLDKVGKWKEIGNIMKDYRTESMKNKPLNLSNPVSTVSNGHVPTGYPAASSQGATTPPEIKSVIPTGSTTYETSWAKNNNKNNNKNKPKNKNKNKSKNKNDNKNNNKKMTARQKNKNKGRKRK